MGKRIEIDWTSLLRRREWAATPPSVRVQIVPAMAPTPARVAQELRLVRAAVTLAELLVVVTTVGLLWSLLALGGW